MYHNCHIRPTSTIFVFICCNFCVGAVSKTKAAVSSNPYFPETTFVLYEQRNLQQMFGRQIYSNVVLKLFFVVTYIICERKMDFILTFSLITSGLVSVFDFLRVIFAHSVLSTRSLASCCCCCFCDRKDPRIQQICR